jgi:type IV pilus assembly protein PilY1
MLPVDYDLDTQTDAVYISTVNGTTGSFAGKLYRLTLRNSDGSGAPNSGTYKDISSWSVDIMLDDVGPISAIANAGVDSHGNRWIFVGTGRFYVRKDAIDSSQQAYYAIKEPRDSTLNGFTWGAIDKTELVNVTNVNVNTDGDLTTSIDTLTGDGTVSTYSALNAAMIKPPSTTFSDVNHGWFRNLGQSPQTAYERNIGQAALLGGVLAFTTFEPSGDICKYEGSSNLYALNFTTGTATPKASVFGTPDTTSGPVVMDEVIDLGEGLVSTISLHTSPGYKKNSHSNSGDPTGDDSTKSHSTDTMGAVAVSSTGEAIQTEIQSDGAVTSGESNWRFAH